jgi:hypothetical protein
VRCAWLFIAIFEKSSPEVRSEFARRISSALDGNERDAENPDAALMTEAAANLIVRGMPDFARKITDGARHVSHETSSLLCHVHNGGAVGHTIAWRYSAVTLSTTMTITSTVGRASL